MSIFKGKKRHWMIVLHKHHVGGLDWRHTILTDATEGEAEAYAALHASRWQGRGIPKVSGKAIALPDTVQVVRQASWAEGT